ncbi:DEAD/DEAH box helicase [Kiritimatiellaeota bacterium B1221]|nr:DEAD/DEAH box helicase [Kiritimatiellaeota bacterium B1221]
MLLVYQFYAVDSLHLSVRCFSLDLPQGDRWTGTAYPLKLDQILAGKVKGLRVTKLDRKILTSMQMHQKIGGNESLFQGLDVTRLLDRLIESGRAYPAGKKNAWPLRAGENPEPYLEWVLEPEGLKTVVNLEEGWHLIPGRPTYGLHADTGKCAPVKLTVSDKVLWKWITTPMMSEQAATDFWMKLGEEFPEDDLPAPPSLKVKQKEGVKPVPVLEVLEPDQTLQIPRTARLMLQYGKQIISVDHDGEQVRWLEKSGVVEVQRDRAAETGYKKVLPTMGLREYQMASDQLFAVSLPETRYELDPAAHGSWDLFVMNTEPAFREAGWLLNLPQALRPTWVENDQWYRSFESGGKEGLCYEQGIEVDGKRINLLPVLQDFLMYRKQKSLEEILNEIGTGSFPLHSEVGLLMIDAGRFQQMVKTLFELFGGGSLDRQDRLRISDWRAAELYDEEVEGWQPTPELLKAVEGLGAQEMQVQSLEPPTGFLGELRDYQKRGLGWIDFLSKYHLGGILADDMGLGKTVQVIASMLEIKNNVSGATLFLVVCPTSVLPNWKLECKKFAPGLRVHCHYGSDRNLRPDHFRQADVLLTTYGTLLRDEAQFQDMKFSGIILDEAQAIKNPRAKISKVVCGLRADLRLALSGTPLENHLGELRSLFQFVLPGYLGTEKVFNAVIRHPIEKDNSSRAKELLRQKTAPILLRRSKDAVATELPPKTEIVQELPLTPQQVDLYEVIRAAGEKDLMDTIADQGFERSQIQVLDVLLKLRQICCDPRICKAVPKDVKLESPVKIQWLREVLPEMLEEGRRILLFSQFTSMLDLIQPELKAMKIPFVEIRGSTKDREKPVKQFQSGKVPVFLISLKAGGTGLNLTAADTVIFFDPWWNPAVEAQAADRAYRIGQDKPVFVYKLICAGTVESRIIELQQQKKALQDVLTSDAGGGMKLSEEDFRNLLSPLET